MRNERRPDPLGDLLRRAASAATDPAVRQWLKALADSGERAEAAPEARERREGVRRA